MALTEQEQIELFNKWWKENGTVIVVTVVVLLAAYFGWTYWQTTQQTQAAKASAIFQQILDQQNGKSHDNSTATIPALAEQLKKDYPNTYYGQAVHLLLADIAVKNNDLAQAETELTTLVQQKPSDVLAFTARLRLARVLYAEAKYDAALAQLAGDVTDAYKSMFSELRGDIYVALNQVDNAKKSYQEAANTLPAGSEDQKHTIEIKLNNLGAVSEKVLEIHKTAEE